MKGLRQRVVEPEIMDSGELTAARHRRALAGLRRLNRISGSGALVWRAIADLVPARGRPPLRVLDVATGSADVPLALLRRARRAGRALSVSASDVSPTALALAAERAAAEGLSLPLFALDALAAPPPDAYDVIVCSLFLHHLDDADAAGLLRRLAAGARRRLVVNDLERSPATLALVGLAARLVTRSDVVHTDAVRSVRAAFTLEELRRLAREAGLPEARVRRSFPCRLLLTREAS